MVGFDPPKPPFPGNAESRERSAALRAIARKAMQHKTGARGLRTILENVLLETMYDLPSQEDVVKVVIDESVIEGVNKPFLVYEGGENHQTSAELHATQE